MPLIRVAELVARSRAPSFLREISDEARAAGVGVAAQTSLT